jgi:cation transport ATPase
MGLLFVAIQVNRDWILKYPTLRGRAAESLLIFVLALIVSMLFAIPGQPVRVLGIEIVVVGAIYGVCVIAAGSKTKEGGPNTRLDRLLSYTTPALLSAVLTLVSGVLLVLGHMSGLYWLTAAMILALTGGIASAWLFLMGTSH